MAQLYFCLFLKLRHIWIELKLNVLMGRVTENSPCLNGEIVESFLRYAYFKIIDTNWMFPSMCQKLASKVISCKHLFQLFTVFNHSKLTLKYDINFILTLTFQQHPPERMTQLETSFLQENKTDYFCYATVRNKHACNGDV